MSGRSRDALLVSLALTAAGAAWAQSAPASGASAADLAKYDVNRNGVLDPAELEARDADASAAVSGVQTRSSVEPSATSGDPAITLSPFEVRADNNGYFQSNTMSGTRINSKIEDLGQSITVMTKEQMVDFAMLDINDVFDYMAGTEGTNTYSDFVVDRTGAVTDNVSLDPNNANRVRGIGNANIAFNNIATTGRVPVDPLWLDSIEVSRGPNANIFGLGNSSGTVNQVPATANLTRDFAKTELRYDSYGGWRTSLDINRMVIPNKLSVRGSLAHQHTGFIRKPAGEDARRMSFQAKYQPFQNTTLSLSWYRYNNNGTRPNYTTPRDNITAWIAAGRPSWDPVTRLITVGGVTYGQGSGGTLSATSTTPITALPSYFNNSPSDGRSFIRIGTPGEAPYWTTPVVTSTTTPMTAVNNNIRYVSTSAVNNYGASQPLFATYGALSDRSIYNWEEINLQATNKQWDDVVIHLAQLDQVFINSAKQTLAGQVAFMREEAEQIQDLPLGPASVNGVIGELYADPNSRNLDGSANPYFGRPYVRSKESYLRERPLLWETTRAQLAYRLDFTQDEGLSRWLGSHQVLGYYEYKNQESRHYAWRHTAVDYSQPYLLNELVRNAPLANRTATNTQYQSSPNHARIYDFYYVGSTPGGGVQYAPGNFPDGQTVPFRWGNTGAFRADPLKLGYTPSPDGSGRNASRQIIVKTQGGVLQSSLLNDRLITTFGLREDIVLDRNGVFAQLTPDFLGFDYGASDQWQDGSTWRKAQGDTKTFSVVGLPFQDLSFLRRQMDSGSGLKRHLAEAVSGLRLTYNKSDNFIAQGPAFDLFLKRLPNQTGTSKDYGFWMTLFDRKFSIRYNHFKTDQINLRNGDISTIAQRVLRADGLNASDAWNLQDRATEWVTQLNPGFTTAQVQAEVARTMGLTLEQIDGLESAISTGSLHATQDMVSKGDEIEINFNPTRHWTISGSVTKTVAINQNAGSTIEDWIALRLPIWEKVEDPRFTQASPGGANIPTGATGKLLWRYISGPNFTAFNYNSTNSAATNFVTFVEGPLAVFRQLEGRPRPQLSKYSAKFSTKYQLAGMSDNKILRNMSIGGSVRWTDEKAIGFLGVQSLPDKITALDTNRPVFTPAEYYVDAFVSYRTRLFNDKVRASFQFNVRNLTEDGGSLLPTQVFPDGTPLAYRIIDPRTFIFSASFEL